MSVAGAVASQHPHPTHRLSASDGASLIWAKALRLGIEAIISVMRTMTCVHVSSCQSEGTDVDTI